VVDCAQPAAAGHDIDDHALGVSMAKASAGGPATKAGRVYEAVRDDILSGRLQAGTPLDEATLAEAYAVSRTPVREALRALDSEGLLVPGTRRQLLVVDISERHRHEITLLRIALEGAATAEACVQQRPDDLDNLRLLVLKQRRCAEDGDSEAFLRLDEQFHLALAEVARMPTLSRMLGQLGAFVRLTRLGTPTGKTHMRGLTREHAQLLDLLERRDATALQEALTTHISKTSPRS
jgi:DNA-binding GntR family transcriptional regulator